jgi:hypothetical protein
MPQQAPADWAMEVAPPRQRVNWWLRTTSSGWQRPPRTLEEREIARRSRLISWIILGLGIVDALLVPVSITNPSNLVAALVVTAGFLMAAALNRVGLVTGAGSLLVLLIVVGLMGVVVAVPGDPVTHALPGQNSLKALPVYDLLAVAVVVAGSILPRVAAFVVAGLNTGLICLDFFLQPRAPDLQQYVTAQGALPLLARPIALQVIIAVVAYLWVRGTDEAIRRADRAEEIAAMEHQLAEQKRQLDDGIRQILETHVRVANGDFGARAPLGQDNVLFQIAASLNNLLNRLGRAGQAEYLYQRTIAEIERLRQSLLAARSGRPPLWPAPSGTPVDGLIEAIAGPARGAVPGQIPQTNPTSGLRGMPSSPMSNPMSNPMGAQASPFPSFEAGRPNSRPVSPSGPQGWAPPPNGWVERGPATGPTDALPANFWEAPPGADWPPPDTSNSGG